MKRRRPSSPPQQRWSYRRTIAVAVQVLLPLAFALSAPAQITLSTAVDLALRTNPRVLGALDDVKRAQAQIDEVHDAYIPSINAGAGIGQAYGYLPNPPTLFTVTAGSLVFNASQSHYNRSARAGFNAATLALADAREAVEQDTALAFVALDHDQRRAQTIRQQSGFADSLTQIIQQRLDAGQDTQIDLTEAKLTAAQLRLAGMKADDDIAYDREHLARLIDLPAASLSIASPPDDFAIPAVTEPEIKANGHANSAVASAFENAAAKQEQARANSVFAFIPQINFFTQYNRYATFTNSFKDLEKNYKGNNGQTLLTANEAAFGIQVTMPFFDKVRTAKARESTAEAAHALHDAENAEIEALDGASRLRHSIVELHAQSDVATLQQQLAQQQLDIVRVQLNTGNGVPYSPQMSPKDEQKARIAERDKYLAVIDANFQVQQAEIQLLRQTGELESSLKSTLNVPTSNVPGSLPPAPAPQR
jgi:outer membrane protein TolC